MYESLREFVKKGTFPLIKRMGRVLARYWPWPVPVVLPTGQRIYVDLRSGIGRGIFMKGYFDPDVFELLRPHLHRGGTFLDVGANVGYYSLLAMDLVGPKGTVHAFEIDPRPLKCLKKTIAGGKGIILHEIAIGEDKGEVFFDRKTDCGHSQITEKNTGFRVPLDSLDHLYSKCQWHTVSALKIDVEGAELKVLRGAKNLLREKGPVVVAEISRDRTEIEEFLTSLGYDHTFHNDLWSPILLAQKKK